MVLYSDLLIGKDVFSRNLEKNERYLIADLKKEDFEATFADPERKHFVDEHRAQLIDRVHNIAPILDQLLEKEVIQPGSYDEILAIPNNRDKMRRLYSGPLNTAGPDDIDVFYRILERHEPYLIADLKKKNIVERATFTDPERKHFVDEHRAQLIDKKEVIQPGIYDEIRDMPTTLNPGPLNAAGSNDIFRNIFSRILEILWPHVIADVKKENIVERATSTDPERPSRSLEPEGCGDVMQASSDWTELEPEVNSTDADEAPTYSLQSEAGNFECSVSGLRWVCKEKVSFKYQFCSLKRHMERIESMQYMPAGPLMDITVIAGKLDEVYLPHWICIDDTPTILDKFAVLHIDDCGDVVEKVSEVTSSHVKLSEPAFSLKMVLVKAGYSVKINSKVLIYGTKTPFFKLRVYLIPPDPGLLQDLEKTESSDGYRRFKKPHPKKPLKMHDEFILTAELGGAEIASDTLQLLYESTEPNFSEVFIEDPVADLTLKLGKEKEIPPVWTCVIRQQECQSTDGPIQGQHFVDRHRVELIERVDNIAPILDQLLSKKIIQQGSYDEIMAIPTKQEKMRRLFSGPLNAAGRDGKDVFYKILQKKESSLIGDLKKSMW